MKATEALQQFKNAIEDVEKTGQSAVTTSNLKTYIDTLAQDAMRQEQGLVASTDQERAHALEVWKTRVSMSAEMLKATVEAGQTALKSAILINGGAAVAMLAFVGNVVTKSDLRPGAPLLSHIGAALIIFVFGAGCAGTSTAFRFLSQRCYEDALHVNEKSLWKIWGDRAAIVSILLGVASFAAFFAGGWIAFRAVSTP